jgi:hypothetical protein
VYSTSVPRLHASDVNSTPRNDYLHTAKYYGVAKRRFFEITLLAPSATLAVQCGYAVIITNSHHFVGNMSLVGGSEAHRDVPA